MRDLAYNLSHGKFCVANVGLAVVAGTAQMTLEERARIYAALATGVWFTVQTALLVIDRLRKRRVKASRAGLD